MSENKVRVFISKKETDWKNAERIKKLLQNVGGDRLEIFISQDITAGDDWRECLKEELATASTLILLFGEPTQEWDWCLYEVGLFTPIHSDKEAKTICFYTSSTKLPAQLDNMQHVPALEDRMKKFIIDFFGTSIITGVNPPLNIRFTKDKEAVSKLARKLCTEVNSRGVKQSLFYNAVISINLDPSEMAEGVIPRNARVTVPKLTLEIFGFLDKPANMEHWTWGILEDACPGSQNNLWIKELAQSIKLSCEGRALPPIRSTLESLNSGKVYRPNINRRDIETDGSVTIHILLIQEPTSERGVVQLTSSPLSVEKEELVPA